MEILNTYFLKKEIEKNFKNIIKTTWSIIDDVITLTLINKLDNTVCKIVEQYNWTGETYFLINENTFPKNSKNIYWETVFYLKLLTPAVK